MLPYTSIQETRDLLESEDFLEKLILKEFSMFKKKNKNINLKKVPDSQYGQMFYTHIMNLLSRLNRARELDSRAMGVLKTKAVDILKDIVSFEDDGVFGSY